MQYSEWNELCAAATDATIAAVYKLQPKIVLNGNKRPHLFRAS